MIFKHIYPKNHLKMIVRSFVNTTKVQSKLLIFLCLVGPTTFDNEAPRHLIDMTFCQPTVNIFNKALQELV